MPMKQTASKIIGFKCSLKMYRRLEAEAAKSGGTISEIVRAALVRYFLTPDKQEAA